MTAIIWTWRRSTTWLGWLEGRDMSFDSRGGTPPPSNWRWPGVSSASAAVGHLRNPGQRDEALSMAPVPDDHERRRDTPLVGRSHLVSLGRGRFWVEKPCQEGLEKLGFPWILSSESSLFNGLRGIKRGNFFLSPSGVRSAGPERWSRRCGSAGLITGQP
jgi:hypothetical protein